MSNKYATLNAVQKLDAVSRIARALGKFAKPDKLTIAMNPMVPHALTGARKNLA